MKDFVNYIVLYSKFLDLNKGLNFLITKILYNVESHQRSFSFKFGSNWFWEKSQKDENVISIQITNDDDGCKVMTNIQAQFSHLNLWLIVGCLMSGDMMFLTPFSKIIQLYRGGQFYWWRKLGVPEENHQSVESQWQALSYNVVSSS